MKIEPAKVFGFESAFRGLRNPMNSWDKSDSQWGTGSLHWVTAYAPDCPRIGPKDLELACKLIKGGSEHRKFLRQIQVWFDITVPIFVWSELDTYKVSTVRNSCSTMHTLGLRDLTQDDFELDIPDHWLTTLNEMGDLFRIAKDCKNVNVMNSLRHEYKNLLPAGFLQKATYSMNYETALAMYFHRRNHRLPEWRADKVGSICSFIAGLPYMEEFILAAEK